MLNALDHLPLGLWQYCQWLQPVLKNKNEHFKAIAQNLKLGITTLENSYLRNSCKIKDNVYTKRKTEPTTITIDNVFLTLEHQFNSKGFNDVRLYIWDDLIST